MADSVQRVTSQSWGGRIKGAVGGVLFGVGAVAIGIVLLFWNEGRAVKRRQTLKEGAATVVSVEAERVDPGREGSLIHLSGMATTQDVLTDPVFGVAVNAIKLRRQVEMYQWRESSRSEEKKKLGGGTETVTTYTYDRGWESRAIDSQSFAEPEGHGNPPMPYSGEEWVASDVTLGAFRLGDSFVGQMTRAEPVAVNASLAEALRPQLPRIKAANNGLYLGNDVANPEIGDTRIQFEAVVPASISVVGQQSAGALSTYRTNAGGTITLVSYGTVSADEMFESAQRSNTIFTWILRLVGFFALFVGFGLIFRPLSVVADVVPFLGNLVGAGTGFAALGVSVFVSLVVIAVGWIFYRPLLGITLLVLAVGSLVWLIRRSRQRSKAKAAELPPLPV